MCSNYLFFASSTLTSPPLFSNVQLPCPLWLKSYILYGLSNFYWLASQELHHLSSSLRISTKFKFTFFPKNSTTSPLLPFNSTFSSNQKPQMIYAEPNLFLQLIAIPNLNLLLFQYLHSCPLSANPLLIRCSRWCAVPSFFLQLIWST